MRYVALAADYDGTLAKDGRVSAGTVAALERFVASGRKMVLVTGRTLDELEASFPRLDLFDRVVVENGAVVYVPATRERRALEQAPSAELVSELRARHVEPLTVGEVIVATREPHQ